MMHFYTTKFTRSEEKFICALKGFAFLSQIQLFHNIDFLNDKKKYYFRITFCLYLTCNKILMVKYSYVWG